MRGGSKPHPPSSELFNVLRGHTSGSTTTFHQALFDPLSNQFQKPNNSKYQTVGPSAGWHKPTRLSPPVWVSGLELIIMGLYNKLPDALREVDVIIAGGKSCHGGLGISSTLCLLTAASRRIHCLRCRLTAIGYISGHVHLNDRGRPEQCKCADYHVPRLLPGTSRSWQHN